MPTTIQFMGKEYSSVEEMPPQVRQTYEQIMKAVSQKYPDANLNNDLSELLSDQVFSGQSMAQATPAWGSHSGRGAVTVPTAFESVTDLGSATAVYQVIRSNLSGMVIVLVIGLMFMVVGLVVGFFAFNPKDPAAAVIPALIFGGIGGLLFLLAVWTLWSLAFGIQALVLYRDGFAYSYLGRGVKTWRWTEIATIVSNETFQTGKRSSWTDRTYTIQKKSGEQVTLTNYQLEKVTGVIAAIKQNTYALLLPPLAGQYNSGQPVTFGPVTVHRDNGIQANGKHYTWDKILDVKVKQGSLLITMKDSSLFGGYHKVRASTIPNIEVLCQIIGVKEIDLAYY